MLFHVLGHVELDQRVLVVKEELGQRLGEFGLTDTGRTEEDERSRRALRVFEARSRATNRATQSLDGLFLSHDALVEFFFHTKQLRRLFLGEAIDGNTGPVRQDFGDGLFIDYVEGLGSGGLGGRVELFLLRDGLALLLFETLGLFEGTLFERGLLVRSQAENLFVQLALSRGRVHATNS